MKFLRVILAVLFVLLFFGLFTIKILNSFPGLRRWRFALIGTIVFIVLVRIALSLFSPKGKHINERDRVSFDDERVVRTLPEGKTESIRWVDLQEVGIITTDEGPWAEDVYWMLMGAQGGCAVSGGAEGNKELLARLQQLPGFDNAAVIKAMGSTGNARFVCWKRDPAEPKDCSSS